MNEKKSTRNGKCFLKYLKNKFSKNIGTQRDVTASNNSEEVFDPNRGLYLFVFAVSCIVIVVCCVLLLKWNYSTPGVTVKTANNVELLENKEDADINKSPMPININTAGVIELCSLPGIGEALADRIIQYRDEHGHFKTIEEIMQVDGIGQKKFNDLKELITVDMEGHNEDTGS